MIGDEEAFYDHEYFKISKIKKDSNTYTQNLKYSDHAAGISQHVRDKIGGKMSVRINNFGLILIILAKNHQALDMILKAYPQFFFDFTDDIFGAALLCTIKQWPQGLTLLLPSFEVAFSKLTLLARFDFIQKLFAILKNSKTQQGITKCLELLLSQPKVAHYIDWQEKNPQM